MGGKLRVYCLKMRALLALISTNYETLDYFPVCFDTFLQFERCNIVFFLIEKICVILDAV